MEEIRPYLKITLNGTEIIEGAPSDTAKKLEEYRRLGKEQWDFAESLNN